jgi:hypothetical protein
MTGSGGATGTVSGKDDAIPPTSGHTGGLPPPRVDPQGMQPQSQPQGSTTPVQQQ